jgi:hypothetical protein
VAALEVLSSMEHGRHESDLLTVAEVMERYRLRDRRAARRVMDAADGFRIGAGLFVRRRDLLDFEDRQRCARLSADDTPAALPTRRTARRPLEPGWWRDDDSSRAA